MTKLIKLKNWPKKSDNWQKALIDKDQEFEVIRQIDEKRKIEVRVNDENWLIAINRWVDKNSKHWLSWRKSKAYLRL